MKSIAMSEASFRDLKDRLEQRGFSVEESKDGNGWPKLTIDTDQASLRMESADAVSKDVFGNDLKAFAPHYLEFAVVDAVSKQDYSKIFLEVQKMGVDKTIVKSGANIAAAEADAGEEIIFDVRWPTKGR